MGSSGLFQIVLCNAFQRIPGIMPFMPRIIFIMPPPFSFFIIDCICSNCVEHAIDFLHLHAGAGGDAALARWP